MTTGMGRSPVGGTSTWLRTALLLTVAWAACAQDPGTAPTDPQDTGLLYAKCMRDNGVPDFPDPDANGEFRGAGHEQQDDPMFLAAMEECRDLAPGGEHEGTLDPAEVEQMREFSQCMRDKGLPDFPDPDADGQLRGAGHEVEGDPNFQAAMEACRQKLPGGGDHQ